MDREMTDYHFKNGITVTIPDGLPKPMEEWTKIKMAMSLILNPPAPKVRKPYTLTKEGLKRRRLIGKKKHSKPKI